MTSMRLTFVAGAVLATAGTALAVAGIHLESDFKLFATGFVLLCGAGVFAILSLGARRAARFDRGNTVVADRRDTL